MCKIVWMSESELMKTGKYNPDNGKSIYKCPDCEIENSDLTILRYTECKANNAVNHKLPSDKEYFACQNCGKIHETFNSFYVCCELTKLSI